MIEIVFSDSALGSLKSAPNMDSNANDIFGFNLMLSIGDIQNDNFIENRVKTIEDLWSIYPIFKDDKEFNLFENTKTGIENIFNRITNNDEVRVWYSDNPDDMCGLYWFVSEMKKRNIKPENLYIVKLPQYEYTKNNTINSYFSWSEVHPDKWHKYIELQEKTQDVFYTHCSMAWAKLQKENSKLRAVLNGNLHSVSQDIYDSFIYKKIINKETEFLQVMIIGSILGEENLGISDSFLAKRMEKMINAGYLEIISQPAKDMPIYHRKLRKTAMFLSKFSK